MSQFDASVDLEPGTEEHTLGQVNAVLFYQLARIVVWGQVHRGVADAHSDLALLLETATAALSRCGILEHPASDISSLD